MVKSTLLANATNYALFTAGIANLFAGTRAVFIGNTTLAGTALTAALVLLLAATIDRFESLKGLGIEAKTKALDQKIEQAEETLHRLQELSEITGKTLITLNSKAGRLSGPPLPEESYELAQKVRQILVSLRLSDEEIFHCLEPWLRIFFFDLATAIINPLKLALSNRAKNLQQKQDVNHLSLTIEEQEELNQIQTYQNKTNQIGYLQYSDYPDKLLQLINDAPLKEEHTKQQVIKKANDFAEGFWMLKKFCYLTDPQPWFEEINGYRNIH